MLQLLREVGFEEVSVEDRTKQFGEILECELKNFEKTKDEFVKVRRCTSWLRGGYLISCVVSASALEGMVFEHCGTCGQKLESPLH